MKTAELERSYRFPQVSRLPAATAVWMSLTSVLVVSLFLTSCLKFGEELEFFAPDVIAAHLKAIETRTGINLPEGSVGMALYSNATGIDPWMLAKIKIPANKVSGLRSSPSFTSPPPATPAGISGDTRPWWKPGELTHASTGQFDIKSNVATWPLGQEGVDHMLYIDWYTY